MTSGPGRIAVIGLGPGDPKLITPHAVEAIRGSQVVVGYAYYLQLIAHLTEGKEMVSTPLGQEIERAQEAIDYAARGHSVALVSSGDAGIYGMAGLLLDLIADRYAANGGPAVSIVPGISAVNAAASRVGAPLMHDFAVISLSDLLTPWDVIMRRVEAAASADFVLAFYNPKSQRRTHQIDQALALVHRFRGAKTPVALVKNAYREGESVTLTTLQEAGQHSIDMWTTVIVGNSHTAIRQGWMITPRGYKIRPRGSSSAEVLLLAGTHEGPLIAQALTDRGIRVVASTVTEHGGNAYRDRGLEVRTGPLTEAGLEEMVGTSKVRLIVDATHPHAAQLRILARDVSRRKGLVLIRFERPPAKIPEGGRFYKVSSHQQAVQTAKIFGGPVFLSVGTKSLPVYVEGFGPPANISFWARVLPTESAIRQCNRLGIDQSHIVAMQGPWSSEFEQALYREYGIRVLIAKESGRIFEAKVQAALKSGLSVILIERPPVPDDVICYSEIDPLVDYVHDLLSKLGKGRSTTHNPAGRGWRSKDPD